LGSITDPISPVLKTPPGVTSTVSPVHPGRKRARSPKEVPPTPSPIATSASKAGFVATNPFVSSATNFDFSDKDLKFRKVSSHKNKTNKTSLKKSGVDESDQVAESYQDEASQLGYTTQLAPLNIMLRAEHIALYCDIMKQTALTLGSSSLVLNALEFEAACKKIPGVYEQTRFASSKSVSIISPKQHYY
jgi:hypothetical protein